MVKKISLEHAIRNIVSEAIGVSGTDKFKGTPKPFLQPAPHIAPKVGDSHPDASAAVAKRGNAKITSSETMKEEEELFEVPNIKKSPNPNKQVDTPPETNYDNEVYVPKKKSIGDVALEKLRAAKSNAAQWKRSSEAVKKGGQTVSTYKELPSEYLQHKTADALAKISGDPDKAERTTKFLGKLGSTATLGLGDIGMNALDAVSAAKQGKTTTASEKGLEALRGAALFAATGVLGNRVAKFATTPEVTSTVSKVVGDIKPPSFFGAQKVKATVPEAPAAKPVRTVVPEAPAAKPEAPKTGGTEPPATTTKKPQYQSFAGKPRSSINARNSSIGPQAREPSSSVSTSISRSGARNPLANDLNAPASKPSGPSGGGGGGGTPINHPSAPENVVSFKAPTDTAPSNAPTAQLKTTDGAKPAPAAPEPVKPAPAAPKPVGPQRRGAPSWRPAPSKPAAPAPVKPESPKVPGMPKFKPFNPNTPFEPKTPANQPAAPKIPAPKSPPPSTVPLAPVVTPPAVTPKSPPSPAPAAPKQTPKQSPGNRPDIGPTQQPSSNPLPAAKPAPVAAPQTATAPALAPAAQTATAPALAPAAQTATAVPEILKKTPDKPGKKENKPVEDKPPKQEKPPGRTPWKLPKFNVSADPSPITGLQDLTPGNSMTHRSKFSSVVEDADAVRRTIENVARPGGKTRIGKQAQIKTKIIDEDEDKIGLIKRVRAEALAKKREQSPIIINPKLKNPDEGSK